MTPAGEIKQRADEVLYAADMVKFTEPQTASFLRNVAAELNRLADRLPRAQEDA